MHILVIVIKNRGYVHTNSNHDGLYVTTTTFLRVLYSNTSISFKNDYWMERRRWDSNLEVVVRGLY
jgi:hypothetical protein